MDKIREKFEKTYNTEYMIYDDRFNRYLISLKNGESVVNVDQLGKMMDELNIRWTTFGNCSKSRDKEIEELKEELEIHKHVLSAQPEKYTYLTFQKIEKENKKLIEALEHIEKYSSDYGSRYEAKEALKKDGE